MLNAEVAKRRDDAISRGVGMMTQIYADRALNSEVWDIEGNRYIDFAAGIATVAWEAPAIGALIKETVAKHGLKMPKLAMPLRVLLTGQTQTPSVDAIIALIGRQKVLQKLSAQKI